MTCSIGVRPPSPPPPPAPLQTIRFCRSDNKLRMIRWLMKRSSLLFRCGEWGNSDKLLGPAVPSWMGIVISLNCVCNVIKMSLGECVWFFIPFFFFLLLFFSWWDARRLLQYCDGQRFRCNFSQLHSSQCFTTDCCAAPTHLLHLLRNIQNNVIDLGGARRMGRGVDRIWTRGGRLNSYYNRKYCTNG